MKRKFWIIVLAIAGALCLALGLAACGGGGGPKEKKVNLGDSPEQVVKLLGEPYEEESSETHYVYLGSNYLSLLKRSAELEERMLNVKNEKEFEKIFQEMAKLETTLASLVYTRTEITFSRNEEGELSVSRIWYDAAFHENAPEKTLAGSSVDSQQCTFEEVVQGSAQNLSFCETYSDGSFRKSPIKDMELNYSISGKNVTWQWEDSEGEHTSASKLKKEGPCRLEAEGAYGGEAVFAIPEGTTSIPTLAFQNCTWLTNIKIPDSVKSIGDYAFEGIYSIENIYITDINAWCRIKFGFESTPLGTLNLNGVPVTDVKGLSGIKRIDGAFSGKSITSIVIPASVTVIADFAFRSCDLLESITFEGNSKLTTIGRYAFDNCSSLKNIAIPKNVTEIDFTAFDDCRSLEKIEVAEENKNYSSQDGILYDKTKTKIIHIPKAIKGAVTISDKITSINEQAFYDRSLLTKIVIPESVTSIEFEAFRHCTSLTSILISAISIGEGAFASCTSLESVEFEGKGNLKLIGKNAFENCIALKNFVIPEGVTEIGEGAFMLCESLTSVTIPTSATKIGDRAFASCSSLKYIVIPEGVTSIGEDAFRACPLTSIVIPDSVTSIGEDAFLGCSGLKNVYYKGKAETWNNISIGGSNSYLTDATRYYFSEGEPDEAKWQESENWWHFDETTGEVVEWAKP